MATTPAKPPRLRFIDMARSVAILLMLEGHFVDAMLQLSARDPENLIFNTWRTIRGFTAPMFLTVTGLIFAYLLTRRHEDAWHTNPRALKGLRRVAELFVWGYLVQSYAFHILECIACGIATILVIYCIQKLLHRIPLWLCLLLGGLMLFCLSPLVERLPLSMTAIEHTWWNLISLLTSKASPVIHFPTVPFVGFTLIGAAIGCLLQDAKHLVVKWWFPSLFGLIGAVTFFTAAWAPPESTSIPAMLLETAWLYKRLGMVLMILCVLMLIDRRYGQRLKPDHPFLKIGQNTLPIYIVHMVVLYGSIFGIGLDTWKHSLDPWTAAIGAIAFCALFGVMAQFVEPSQQWLKARLACLRNKPTAEP